MSSIHEMQNNDYGGDKVLLADGFEDAFIGLARQFNKCFAVYDHEKMHQDID